MQSVAFSNDLTIKKDVFIKTRKEDIRQYYDFNPKLLGKGAYGAVYKARLKQPPHCYRVVKIIPKNMVVNPEIFQNQIDILRSLDYPLIVRLYEAFQDERNFCLVLDYCEGGELFDRLQSHGSFNENDARELFTHIIKCVNYMHLQKIAHRDLKPENFLMANKKTLQLKIIDFGLSYRWTNNMREQIRAEKKNTLIGTSYYIAPQVLKMDYDQRCDIWSAGVILYILVTGAPPFDGLNDRTIMDSVRRMKYTFDIPQAKQLSPEIKDLIKKILVPAQQRITVEGIFEHPWMTKQLPQIPLKLDFKKLKTFSHFSKLKSLTVTYIATQLPDREIHHLGLLFQQIDTNSDGYITLEQLKAALDRQSQKTQANELTAVLKNVDTDHNGKISYNQFVASCLENTYLQSQAHLQFIFKGLDTDGSGKLSKQQIKTVFLGAGLTCQSKLVDQVVSACDKNGDGEIDYIQFLAAMGIRK